MTVLDPTRADWLTWRHAGIGASDVAALVGLSPWTSRWALWADKVGLVPDDVDVESEVMEFGRRFEPVAGPWFADLNPGLYVAGEQKWCTHPDLPWARCTVDGLVFDEAGPADPDVSDALGTFEVKVDFRHGEKTWLEEIPPHYQCQAQWQMFVARVDRTWFGVLHPFGRFRVYELARDPADIALLVETAERFWHNHVLTGIPPDVDGSDATTTALAAAWPDPAGTVELDPALVAQARAARDVLDAAKAADDEARNRLRAALADRTEGTVDGLLVASWRRQATRKIDPGLVRTLHPAIVDEVTKTTESRVLRLHDPK